MQLRPIHQIAADIRRHWADVNYAAEPYLQAMARLGGIQENFGSDDAEGIVLRFLGNARGFRGDQAKVLKAELKAHLAAAKKNR